MPPKRPAAVNPKQPPSINVLDTLSTESLRTYLANRAGTENPGLLTLPVTTVSATRPAQLLSTTAVSETQRLSQELPVQIISEETTRKNAWISTRESYVGSYNSPQASETLLNFVVQARSGLIQLSESEKERLTQMTKFQAHWFLELTKHKQFSGESEAAKTEFRLFLGDLAAIMLSTEQRLTGQTQINISGVSRSFSCHPDTFALNKYEVVQKGSGTNQMSEIMKFLSAKTQIVPFSEEPKFKAQRREPCTFCHKPGHTSAACFTRIREEEAKNSRDQRSKDARHSK